MIQAREDRFLKIYSPRYQANFLTVVVQLPNSNLRIPPTTHTLDKRRDFRSK
jgi:hypothetical protein